MIFDKFTSSNNYIDQFIIKIGEIYDKLSETDTEIIIESDVETDVNTELSQLIDTLSDGDNDK